MTFLGMANLPVITGLGGINAAGRSSGNHSYRRMIFDCLSQTEKLETQTALAALTGRTRWQLARAIHFCGVKLINEDVEIIRAPFK